jgi:hypothetical protein
MDFGVHLPHMGREASGPVLRKFASELERLDVHSAIYFLNTYINQ